MRKRQTSLLQWIFFIAIFCFQTPLKTQAGDLDFLFKQNQRYENAVIKNIVTSDTLTLKLTNGEEEDIKLIGLKGIDTPRRVRTDAPKDRHGFRVKEDTPPDTPFEERVFNDLKRQFEGEEIRIEFDKNKSGSNFETLAYVFLKKDNSLINTEILKQGYASLRITPQNQKYKQELRNAYLEALRERRGIHGQ